MCIQCIVGMVPFMFMLFATVFMFALVNYELDFRKYLRTPKSKKKAAPSFIFKLGDQYMTMFGNNPGADEMDTKEWLSYIGFSIFISIVCLNLLIAVISDIYAKVSEIKSQPT